MQDVAVVILTLLFIVLQPLYLHSGSVRLGSVLLSLLGSMGCIVGLIIVLHFLLRPETPGQQKKGRNIRATALVAGNLWTSPHVQEEGAMDFSELSVAVSPAVVSAGRGRRCRIWRKTWCRKPIAKRWRTGRHVPHRTCMPGCYALSAIRQWTGHDGRLCHGTMPPPRAIPVTSGNCLLPIQKRSCAIRRLGERRGVGGL